MAKQRQMPRQPKSLVTFEVFNAFTHLLQQHDIRNRKIEK